MSSLFHKIHPFRASVRRSGVRSLSCSVPSLFLACTFLLAGCAAFLPDGRNTVDGPWKSFEEAQQSFDRIEPYRTTVAELKELNLDPSQNPNITVLNYSDVIRRFVPLSQVNGYALDKGVAECISANAGCNGYEIDQKYLKRDRYGNFWLDFFNFRRNTATIGWHFNGVLLVKGDLVIFKLTGGQPMVKEDERRRNPLGPLQGFDSIRIGN